MIEQIITLLYSILFFATPLIMTKSTSELFEFNKILLIYASTVLITFFWFLKILIARKIILKKTPLDIPIFIFFISQVISTLISIDRHASIFGYYGRFNGGLLSIVCYITLFYAFVSNLVSIKKILKVILLSSLTVIFWAIPGHFGHDLTCLLFTGQFNNSCWDNTTLAFRPELRAFSTLGQPNWLGAYLAVAFFIGIYFLISQKLEVKSQNLKSKVKSIIWSIYLFLNFSMILFTRSRSAIGAVVVGLIIFVGYYYFFIKSNFKKLFVILFLVTLLPIILFKTGEGKIDKYISISNIKNQISKLQIKDQKKIVGKVIPSVKQLSNVTESFDIRKIVWEGAWKLALKYPLFGTGVETFAYSYYLVRPVAHNLTSEWDYVYNKAHNEYFNYLATTGFIGLGAYLLIIFIFQFSIFNQFLKFKFSNNEKSVRNEKFKMQIEENKFNKQMLIVTLSIAYVTILITNFFGFSTTTIQLFFFLIPAFIFADQNRLIVDAGNLLATNSTSTGQKVGIFMLSASAIYLLFSISIYYLADVNYSYGLKYSKVNNQQKGVEYFEKALKLRQEPVYMDKFSSSLAYLSALAHAQNEVDMAKNIANISDTYNRKTVQDYPENVFYWKTRAKNMYYFYLVTGKQNELLQGINALKTAQKLAPTDPKIPYSIALYSSTLFDISENNLDKQKLQEQSLEEINKVIDLKSNYREGYLLKGQLLKKYVLNIEAKQVLEGMLEKFGKNDKEVLKELNNK